MCEVGKEPRAPAQAFEETQRLGEIVDTWRQLIFNQWLLATIIKNVFQWVSSFVVIAYITRYKLHCASVKKNSWNR